MSFAGHLREALPEAFQAFLQDSFGVSVPVRASDLGLAIPVYEDMSDPMRQWMNKVCPK